jgi:steroid delta-isomerase-like uncharacterized protein
MSDSPESVVRDFIAACEHDSVEKLVAFLSEDAVYTDPRGVQSGLDAIKKLFEGDLQIFPSTTLDIKNMASNEGIVMVERVDTFPIEGQPISVKVVGVFEVRADGLIKKWSEYYDSRSITNQLKAAGIAMPK